MAFLCGAEGSELLVGDGLKAMLSQPPEALQLGSNHPLSLGLMVQRQGFHGLRIQGVVRHEHLAQISFHELTFSPWLS